MTDPPRRSWLRAVQARLVAGYVVLLVAFALVATVVLVIGGGFSLPPSDEEPAGHEAVTGPITGSFEISEEEGCLGGRGTSIVLSTAGELQELRAGDEAGGQLAVADGELTGTLTCRDRSTAEARLQVIGPAAERSLVGEIDGARFLASAVTLSGEESFGRLMLAIAAVILVARLVGLAIGRLGQPRVMGEVLGGILLGPSLLGAVAPDAFAYLFPPAIQEMLRGAAEIGLAFYMFLVGLELDPSMIRGRVGRASFISNASVLVPMALGMSVALLVYADFGRAGFLPFALFMGVAMSITAFPVLARILTERRMLRSPVGATAMAAAAVDDVTAWALLALATAVAASASGLEAVRVIGLALVFSAVMALGVRRVVSRVSRAYDEVGALPGTWFAAILLGILLSAFTASAIGVAAIFGAFVMGMIMPRRADLTHDITERVEPFVVTVLLPLFFVVTGLRTEIGLISRPELWIVAALLIAVAVLAKWGGAMVAARFVGFDIRESAAIGALMNTRGLTELIVLNIGLERGVITPELFTMLVLMALVTTLMTGPAMVLIDRRNRLGDAPGAELERELRATAPAAPAPGIARAAEGALAPIVVAPQDLRNLPALLAIAEPLAATPAVSAGADRELILAGLLPPGRGATGPASDDRRLRDAAADLNRQRDLLVARGRTARAVAFVSPDPAADLARTAARLDAGLLLVDGQRPILRQGLPGGLVTRVLQEATCDVAVLIERRGAAERLPAARPIVVPFGGAEHDWAALELAANLALAHGTWIRLLGAAGDAAGERPDASGVLAAASLAVQRLTGIRVEPGLITAGDSLIEASAEAAVLVIGLSERWREEGLGNLRTEIARRASAPTVFVRRGARPGALSGPETMTRMGWSSVGLGAPPSADASPPQPGEPTVRPEEG